MSSTRFDRSAAGSLLIAGLSLVACVRDPLTGVCPDAAPGELILTEIRGPQDGTNRDVQWLELRNLGDQELALGGLRVEFTNLQGEPDGAFFVRDGELVVAPGEAVVLGGGNPALERYVDYDYTRDWSSTRDEDEDGVPDDDDGDGEPDRSVRDLPGAGYVALESCGVELDRVFVARLPPCGTLFWPEGGAGDRAGGEGWASDCAADMGGSHPGTPGEANDAPACSDEQLAEACS